MHRRVRSHGVRMPDSPAACRDGASCGADGSDASEPSRISTTTSASSASTSQRPLRRGRRRAWPRRDRGSKSARRRRRSRRSSSTSTRRRSRTGPRIGVNGWGRILDGPCDLDKGPCGLRAWQAIGQVDGARADRRWCARARELGVAVFFITGRPANLREATERNLQRPGIHVGRRRAAARRRTSRARADFKAPSDASSPSRATRSSSAWATSRATSTAVTPSGRSSSRTPCTSCHKVADFRLRVVG